MERGGQTAPVGSIPQPNQKLTGIYAERANAVVDVELVKARMPGSDEDSGMPGEGAIVLIGSAHHEVGVGRGEGHRVGVGCFGILQDRGGTGQGPPEGSS